MENKQSDLMIPEAVSDQKVFISGFGTKEAFYIGMSFVVDLFISLIINGIFHQVFITVIIAFLIPVATAVFVRKNERKKSVIDVISDIIEFAKSQHKYMYRRYDWVKEYELKIKNESEVSDGNSKNSK